MTQKSIWISSGMIGGVSAALVIFILIGGLYTITGPNGPVDTAYKMNRLTGQVWLVKTYTKQVGDIRVLTAREAEVEKTKLLSRSELPSVAMQDTAPSDRRK
jgi:hypothetical protein